MLSQQKHNDPAALALCKIILAGKDGDPPEWIKLMPAGISNTVDGRTFNNSNPQGVVDAFNATDLDLPIDYEHSSQLKAPNGDPAPAAGWITAMEVRDGAIWGRSEWTPNGDAILRSREYRYISPAFYHSKKGVVVKMASAGLTNKPALSTLPAVAHETKTEKRGLSTMEPKLLALLGLSTTATLDDALEAIKKSIGHRATLSEETARLRGDLKASEELLATAAETTPALDKFVPRADHDVVKLRAETAEKALETQKQEAHSSQVDVAIDAALKAGKITPATVEYHKAQCSQEGGLELFAEYIKNTEPVVEPSKLGDKSSTGDTSKLSELQKNVAKLCNLTEEQYSAAL